MYCYAMAFRLLWHCGTVHQKGHIQLAEHIVQRGQLPQIDTALTKWAPRIRLVPQSLQTTQQVRTAH